METGSIDVCNFDASWSGGPTAWRRTAAVATTYGVQMAHHEEPQVAAHLIASQPHGTYAECFTRTATPSGGTSSIHQGPLTTGASSSVTRRASAGI
jgi:L-alanine-DL-glutamate epimerase-like enolase superfamily enzyme